MTGDDFLQDAYCLIRDEFHLPEGLPQQRFDAPLNEYSNLVVRGNVGYFQGGIGKGGLGMSTFFGPQLAEQVHPAVDNHFRVELL